MSNASPEFICQITDARLQDPDFVKSLDAIARSSAGALEGAKFNWDGSVIDNWSDKEDMLFGLSRMIEYHIIKLCPKYSPLFTSTVIADRMKTAEVSFEPVKADKTEGTVYLHGVTGERGCSTYGRTKYKKVQEKIVVGAFKNGKPRTKTEEKYVDTGVLENKSKYLDGFNPDWTIAASLEHTTASSEFWHYRKDFLDGITSKGDARLFERVRLFFLRSMISAVSDAEDAELSDAGCHQKIDGVSLADRLADPFLRYRKTGLADRMVFNSQSWSHLKV